MQKVFNSIYNGNINFDGYNEILKICVVSIGKYSTIWWGYWGILYFVR